jgi:hypothetical protein
MQTNTVLMVRHAAFMSNQETQPSNAFQKRLTGIRDVQIQAQIAFDSYVRALRSVDIDVHIVDDVAEHGTPDSLFPNNWIATLEDGTLYPFPMEASNRRRERRQEIINRLVTDFVVNNRVYLSAHELKGHSLEGTGSAVVLRLSVSMPCLHWLSASGGARCMLCEVFLKRCVAMAD